MTTLLSRSLLLVPGLTVTAAVALALTVAGCAKVGGDNASVGTDGGSTGTGGLGGITGTQCQIALEPVTPSTFSGLSVGSVSRVRLRGSLSGVPGVDFSWQWGVTFADGTDVPFNHPNGAFDLIEFGVSHPGSYTIVSTLSGGVSCRGEKTVVIQADSARSALFRFHFTPPPETVPPQDQVIQIFGATPTGGNRIPLSRGIVVRFDPRDPSMPQTIPAYVRISDSAGRVINERRTTAASGSISVALASGIYSMLMIPDADVAPVLLAGKSPAELAAAMPLVLAPGVAITGTISDDAGPIAGARVVLRDGTRPSTLGASDASGRFTLRAGAGVYGATITRDSGDGVLEATLAASDGLIRIQDQADGQPAPSLSIHLSRAAPRQLTLPLTSADATSLGPDARVVVESAAPLLDVTTVTFGASPAHPASVRFRSERAPAIDGVTGRASVSVTGLPPAHYRATVFPGGVATADAVTVAADIDLSSQTAVTWPIRLQGKVALAGRLLPAAQAEGVRLTAVDVASDFPSAVGSDALSDGAFSLPVSPGRSYSLRAIPAAGASQAFARAIFPSVAVGAAGAILEDHAMPRALAFAGQVVDDSLQGIGVTVVQVFCVAGSADCIDTEAPLAETVTRGDGSFQVMLPDPGLEPSP